MSSLSFTAAVQALAYAGFSSFDAERALAALKQAGLHLADPQQDEFVCRWVNVLERAVPSEADTIIRTITKTNNGISTSSTHWLDGLREPRT